MKKTIDKKNGDGAIKGILMAHLVLLLHIAIIAVLGLLVLFFRGVVNYMLWIFLGGTALVTTSALLMYRRMKREGKTLQEMLRNSMFNGRPVEISFFGGLASMRIGNPDNSQRIEIEPPVPHPQLEDPAAERIRNLSELSRMLEKNLITRTEFDIAKNRLFGNRPNDFS